MRFSIICGAALYAAGLSAAAPCNGNAFNGARDLLPTVTAAYAAAPTLCGNAGLQWAYFYENNGIASQNADPSLHKRDLPQTSGLTNFTHVKLYGDYYLYDNKRTQGIDLDHMVVEHRGYIFAPESGVYTFQAGNVDDGLWAYLGPLAYGGWAKGNWNQSAYWLGNKNGASTWTATLDARTYYPFRLVTRNAGGPGLWDYNITAPSGFTILHNDPKKAMDTPFIVQKSCDGILAPAYPPWGQES